MELSEEERQALAQIEDSLNKEHPDFAELFKTPNGNPAAFGGKRHRWWRLAAPFAALVAGLLMMLAGVATQTTLVGVAGFVTMLTGAATLPLDGKLSTGRRTWLPRRRR